jgi:hypothetical protein
MDPIRKATAETLRQVAGWPGVTQEELYEIARQVEEAGDEMCCAVCEETTCDSGCPLSDVRSAL